MVSQKGTAGVCKSRRWGDTVGVEKGAKLKKTVPTKPRKKRNTKPKQGRVLKKAYILHFALHSVY